MDKATTNKTFSSIQDAFHYLVDGDGWDKLTFDQRNEIRGAKRDFLYNRGISEKRMLFFLEKFASVVVKIEVQIKM